MFTDTQIAALNKKLDGEAVKTRKQGSATLSYIEGYAAIENANRIFGYGHWAGSVLELTQVEAGEFTNSNSGKSGHRAAHIARYRVTVYANGDRNVAISFDDVGYGSGTSYNSLGEAIESSVKEAVTDAMKRAMRNFGNQFGLALYDKEQRNVDRGEFDPAPARAKIVALPAATVADVVKAYETSDRDELVALYKEIAARGEGK